MRDLSWCHPMDEYPMDHRHPVHKPILTIWLFFQGTARSIHTVMHSENRRKTTHVHHFADIVAHAAERQLPASRLDAFCRFQDNTQSCRTRSEEHTSNSSHLCASRTQLCS